MTPEEEKVLNENNFRILKRFGWDYNKITKLSICCNAVKYGSFCSNCKKASIKSILKPKYKQINNGIYREIEYKVKTRYIIIEKTNKNE